MVTIETVVALAIREPGVMEQLGAALRSDLVLANPFYLRITAFANDFFLKYRTLPRSGDWEVWLESLETGMIRDGTTEALGRLRMQNVSDFHPSFFADQVFAVLQQAAARTARARLNELTDVSPETFTLLAERVRSIEPNAAVSKQELFPTLGQVITGHSRLDEIDTEPAVIIPRLAWGGRHVLLVGSPKVGKSTLAAAGAAAVTRRAVFLGERAAYGRVLWLALDEHRDDALPRLLRGGARRDRLAVVNPADPVAFLHSIFADSNMIRPDLVIVDTLIELARRSSREPPKSGDAGAWSTIMRPLTNLAHDYDIALVTIHHSRKQDGRYRDSTEIAGAVDGIVTMLGPNGKDNDGIRRLELMGRYSITQRRHRFSVRLMPELIEVPLPGGGTRQVERDHYELGEAWEGRAPEEERAVALLDYIAGHPGTNQNTLFREVGGDEGVLRPLLEQMVERGEVRLKKRGRAFTYYLVSDSETEAVEGKLVD